MPGTRMPNTTLDSILAQFREDVRHNRDLGVRFERLMQQFFRVDPLYLPEQTLGKGDSD